jgi:hypothetical protein
VVRQSGTCTVLLTLELDGSKLAQNVGPVPQEPLNRIRQVTEPFSGIYKNAKVCLQKAYLLTHRDRGVHRKMGVSKVEISGLVAWMALIM